MSQRAAIAMICFALFAGLLCAGCSGGSVISETSAAQAFSLSTERLSDTRETTVSVGDSASAALSASVTQKSGSLSILIADTSGDVLYSGSDIASATTFTLLLEGPADYTVKLTLSSFTGSVDFTWETVGATVTEPPAEPEPAPSASQDEPDGAPSPSTEMVITNTAPEPEGSGDPAAEAPEWNGRYENAGSGVVIELFWADNNTVEFRISGNGSVVTATAQIDGAEPSRAEYIYGDEMTLTFELTGTALNLTQAGTCSLVPDSIAGEYFPAAENAQ